MQRCHAYTVVSFTPIVWSRHTTPSILHWRESALHGKRPNNGCKRDYAYCCSSTKKNIKIICLKLVALKISFYVILLRKANWNSVGQCCLDSLLTIHNKMQVIYKEMIQDGAKSNVAKRNLMGGVQFKHVKHCLLFM